LCKKFLLCTLAQDERVCVCDERRNVTLLRAIVHRARKSRAQKVLISPQLLHFSIARAKLVRISLNRISARATRARDACGHAECFARTRFVKPDTVFFVVL